MSESFSISFQKLELEWMSRRRSIILSYNTFISTKNCDQTIKYLKNIPRGNVNQDSTILQCEKAWNVISDSHQVFESILEEMHDIINDARNSLKGFSASQALDRGISGNATSPIDFIQTMMLKMNMYRNDSSLFDSVLQMLTWDNNVNDIEKPAELMDGISVSDDSETLNALGILLESNPFIDDEFIDQIDYQISLNDQIRQFEKSTHIKEEN